MSKMNKGKLISVVDPGFLTREAFNRLPSHLGTTDEVFSLGISFQQIYYIKVHTYLLLPVQDSINAQNTYYSITHHMHVQCTI